MIWNSCHSCLDNPSSIFLTSPLGAFQQNRATHLHYTSLPLSISSRKLIQKSASTVVYFILLGHFFKKNPQKTAVNTHRAPKLICVFRISLLWETRLKGDCTGNFSILKSALLFLFLSLKHMKRKIFHRNASSTFGFSTSFNWKNLHRYGHQCESLSAVFPTPSV